MLQRYLGTRILLLIIVLLVAGCGRPDVAPTATVPPSTFESTGLTYTVQRGRVIRKLEFDGRISPVQEMLLYFKTPGYVKRVLVKQGDQVKAGDLLAELETDDLLNQIAQAEVALSSAQLLLSEAEKSLERQSALTGLNLTIAQTRLTQAEEADAYAITQAELTLALAREQLTRTKTLQTTYTAAIVAAHVGRERAEDAVRRAESEYQEASDRPDESQEVRDGYARALQQARWDLQVAQAQYDQAIADNELSKRTYEYDLKLQEIAVKQAEAELEKLKKGADPLLTLEVQRAQLELDWLPEGVDPVLVNDMNRAQLALERLQGYLADAQIVAPADGEVVSLSLRAGQSVEAYRTVVIVADPSLIEVSADLSSDQLQDLVEGQPVVVALRGDPERSLSGTVRRLPYPYGTGGRVESLTTVAPSMRIRLEGDTSDLRIGALGALAQVTIVLEEKDDVLWLPPAAICSFQDHTFVLLQDGDRQRRVDVELGIESQAQVEILTGLEEGQVVFAP